MAELDCEYQLVDSLCHEDVALPTPSPRATKQEGAGADDRQLELDQLFDQTERACSFEEYRQVLDFCSEKERKDLATIQNLPQLMKEYLFFQNEDMLSSSKDRVKANATNDEELNKFVNFLNQVANNQQDPFQQQKALKLIAILNKAITVAENGNTSLQSSNKVFEKIAPVFQETNTFSRDKVEVSYLPLELLREATQCNKQRQQYLRDGNLDDAEKCLSDAMERIDVSVLKADKQKNVAEKKYTEVACTNRHVGVQKLDEEVRDAITTDNNRIDILKTHCHEDLDKIEKASHTLERVYQNSKLHSQQLNDFQIRELERNKKEQEELEARLRVLRDSAKKIARQRDHAGKQDKSGGEIYEVSKKKMSDWREQIATLQTQAQHASGVLNLVQECSNCVTQEFYQVHKQYLSDLNTVAVESLQLYRKCLVGSIVAFKFRTQELVTNISQLEYLMAPKREELMKNRRTGLKVVTDPVETQLRELGEYKHLYMSAKQSLDPRLEEAFQRLATLDTAIMHRVPDARLDSVDAIYEEECKQLDNEWDNYEMQSLTRAYH